MSEAFCFVAIDGSSIKLTDWKRCKDFGAIGPTNIGARGLKVINAYAVCPDGVPLGLLDQQWWRRKARKKRSDCQNRLVGQKETRFWLAAIRRAAEELDRASLAGWFLVD